MLKSSAETPAFSPYRQIKLLITQSLVSGEWGPGDPIPSEIELASRISVSQGTVRKAVSELAGRDLLIRFQGKGTFVASHAEERSKFSFLR
jgi:GntR family transcriptional regulator